MSDTIFELIRSALQTYLAIYYVPPKIFNFKIIRRDEMSRNTNRSRLAVNMRKAKRKRRDRVSRCRQHRHNNHLLGRHGYKTVV